MDRNFRLTVLFLVISLVATACAIEVGLPKAQSGKPSGGVLSPPHGSQFRAGDVVTVQSFATDSDGIARVDLFVDGLPIRSDSTPNPQGQTYFAVSQQWQAVQGTHTMTVRAYTVQGRVGDIGSVLVNVLPSAKRVPESASPTTALLPAATLAPTITMTFTPTPTMTVTPTPTITPLPQGNCADPNARWDNVTDGQTIGELMAFAGTAAGDDFAEYQVQFQTSGGVLYRSTTPVVHGVIFVWNTLTVGNGNYGITLTVVRKDGTTLAPCVVQVRVAH